MYLSFWTWRVTDTNFTQLLVFMDLCYRPRPPWFFDVPLLDNSRAHGTGYTNFPLKMALEF